MGLSRLDPADFFCPQYPRETAEIREQLLAKNSAGLIWPLDTEDMELINNFAQPYLPEPALPHRSSSATRSSTKRLSLLCFEPDFVLLSRPELIVLGGCVCFPSGWNLTDKVGKPIEFAHAPVPDLNARLGRNIRTFLSGLKVGETFQRFNWGLSSSDRLDQSPQSCISPIDPDFKPTRTFLRIEWQALAGLSPSRLLFAIRIFQYDLATIRADRPVASLLASNLATMSEPVLRYKRLVHSRAALVAYLNG